MRKLLMIVVPLLTLAILIGCNKHEQQLPTYKATGVIETVEKTDGVVEGVKTEYVIKLVNIESGSTPDPKDVSTINISITKNTDIYVITNGKQTKTDISAIEKGKRAEIVWRFANDHLTEAIEINMK